MKIFFKGFNYSQDGPGNRLVFHLQGCNMRCPWCSNPEGMSFDGGHEYSTARIVNECLRSRAMFFGGGGVTFTGGEATMQAEELTEVLKSLKEHNIHTALETNGTSHRLPEIAEYVDYLMMDFKHYNDDAFKKYTGVGIDGVRRNFERLCKNGRFIHIRIPLINNVNADDPQKFAECFTGYNTSNCVFEFLPYHEYGKEKWTEEYKITDGFVPAAVVAEFKRVFEEHNLKIINT